MEQLKPCPFCGQAAVLESNHWSNGTDSWHVFCGNVDCLDEIDTGDYNNATSAINAWNRRFGEFGVVSSKRNADLLQNIHRLELKLEEKEKHLDEKDAIIRKLVLMLPEPEPKDE